MMKLRTAEAERNCFNKYSSPGALSKLRGRRGWLRTSCPGCKSMPPSASIVANTPKGTLKGVRASRAQGHNYNVDLRQQCRKDLIHHQDMCGWKTPPVWG